MPAELSAVVADLWYPLGHCAELAARGVVSTTLLDEPLHVDAAADSVTAVGSGRRLPVRRHYGYLWTSLGEPEEPFTIPEHDETDRRNIHAGSVGVRVSAPRAIENFLDMAHFSYVHDGILGSTENTEVASYNARIVGDGREVVATECRFHQPRAVANSTTPTLVEYVYRVPHPYCAVLYKSSTVHPGRDDIVALFLQPLSQESIRAHMLLVTIDDGLPDADWRAFQLKIFAQDKPILENQVPRRLPLDLTAEMPSKADKVSVLYRRWLAQRGVDFGTIPAGMA